MRSAENLGPVLPNEAVIQKLKRINQLLRNLYGGRERFKLSSTEKEELEALRRERIFLAIQALEMRREGDSSIQVIAEGREDEQFHEFSRNKIHIEINPGVNSASLVELRIPFDVLQRYYEKDLAQLIGAPDQYRKEVPTDYILRTIDEALSAGFALDQATDMHRRSQLNVLKVSLAERVLQARANGEIGEGEISVAYERPGVLNRPKKAVKERRPMSRNMQDHRGGLVAINYDRKSQRSRGFHILDPDAYLFPNKIKELIRLGGGYNKTSVSNLRR